MSIIEVRTTIDSKAAAQMIADTLVRKHLAACVQISGPITSTYWRQEKIEHAEEWICTIKTRRRIYKNVEEVIKTIHSYETPEILATEIIEGYKNYTDWIIDETE